MEADAPYGTYDIRITENGNLGFTREGYTYTFHCQLPLKKRFALSIFTAEGKTIIEIGNRKKKPEVFLSMAEPFEKAIKQILRSPFPVCESAPQ